MWGNLRFVVEGGGLGVGAGNCYQHDSSGLHFIRFYEYAIRSPEPY